MDTYSNILFVKEAFGPLSHLAHRLAVTDKFTPEACCVVGNYYSLKVGLGGCELQQCTELAVGEWFARLVGPQ